MPRLSIIIPFSGDEVGFETTLVSVLESRPADCEILVSHDGTYSDPYQLNDEVLFIEASKSASEVTLINEAMRAACAPVLHVLRCGVRVVDSWVEEPLKLMQTREAAVVIPNYVDKQDGMEYAGLDHSQLWCRKLIKADDVGAINTTAPLLSGFFIKRRQLLALDGLRDRLTLLAAEADLALALSHLNAKVEIADIATIQIPHEHVISNDAAEFQAIGEVVAQYDGIIGQVGQASHMPTLMERMLASLNVSRMAAVRGFMKGYKQAGGVSSVRARLEAAKRSIEQNQRPVLGVVDSDASTTASARDYNAVRKAA